jgi:hypothetical protein
MKLVTLTALLSSLFAANAFAQNQVDCGKVESNLSREADRCLTLKDQANRKRCFDGVGKQTENPKLRHCEPTFQRMAEKYSSKEKQMYPNDMASIQNGGPKDHGPGQGHPSGANANCSKVDKKVRRMANRCLAKKRFNQRKKCFDRVGKMTEKPQWRNCEETFERLANEFAMKEKQKFPNQPAALVNGGPKEMGGPEGNMEFKGEPMMKPKYDQRMCQKVAKMVKKRARNCMRKKNFKRRQKCFHQVGEAKWKRVQDGCKETLDPLADNLMKQEMAKYGTNSLDDKGPAAGGHGVKGPQMADNKGHSLKFCRNIAKRTKSRVKKCVKKKKQSARARCFKSTGEFIHKRVGDGCREQLEPLKQWAINAEMAKYGTNSIDGDKNHHHDGIAGTKDGDRQGHSKVQCRKVAKQAKTRAKRCLKKKNEMARKRCLDNVGEGIHRRVGEGCRHEINPVRDWVVMQEKKRYGTNSVDGGKDDKHHHDGLAPQTAKVDPRLCRSTASFAQVFTNKCLYRYKKYVQRKRCMDLGKKYVDKRLKGADACHAELDQVISRYIAQEKQKYPDQPSAVE